MAPIDSPEGQHPDNFPSPAAVEIQPPSLDPEEVEEYGSAILDITSDVEVVTRPPLTIENYREARVEIKPESPVFTKLTDSLKDPDWILAAVNEQSKKAYPGNDKKEIIWNNPSPEVSTQTPGLFGTESAANIIAVLRNGGDLSGDGFTNALRSIASFDGLSGIEEYIVRNCMHATWRTSQARDMGRYGRDVNRQFNQLPLPEVAKDDVQAKTGASILLTTLAGEAPASDTARFAEGINVSSNAEDHVLKTATEELRNVRELTEQAAQMYAESGDHDTEYDPMKNIGQIFAAEAAANIICSLRNRGNVTGEGIMEVLDEMSREAITSEIEKLIMKTLSKTTWRVGLSNQGREEMKKESNAAFAQSPDFHQKRDRNEIEIGADYILDQIREALGSTHES